MQPNGDAKQIIEHLRMRIAMLETQNDVLMSFASSVSDAVNLSYTRANRPMGILDELRRRALDALARVATNSPPD